MEPFIKKHQFNYIKKCLNNLNNTFTSCLDKNITETTKLYIQNKIINIFNDLSKEQQDILDISKINEPLQISTHLNDLDKYVYGMPIVTKEELRKLFKKEKKLKLPDEDIQNSKNVYLGWIDKSTKKLFIVYNMKGKLLGMTCKILNQNSQNIHGCSLCHGVGNKTKVAFVSPVCKTYNKNGYKSIAFDICLNSKKCNNEIVSVEKLEKFLKIVNNIK